MKLLRDVILNLLFLQIRRRTGVRLRFWVFNASN